MSDAMTPPSVDEFLAEKVRSPKSKLHAFRADIQKLRNADCTLDDVQEYLRRHGVVVSYTWVSKYVRQHIVAKGHEVRDVPYEAKKVSVERKPIAAKVKKEIESQSAAIERQARVSKALRGNNESNEPAVSLLEQYKRDSK